MQLPTASQQLSSKAMLRATLNAPRRLGRRLRFFADDADPTELPQKPPPVCVPLPITLNMVVVRLEARVDQDARDPRQ